MVIFFLFPNLCQLLPTQLYVFSLALETKNQDKQQKQTKKKVSKTKTKPAQAKTRFAHLNKVFVQYLPRDRHCQKSGESMVMLRLIADFTSPF